MFLRGCRLVCNLRDLLVCRVCINYPGALLVIYRLVADPWLTGYHSLLSDGFVSEEMMMKSRACLVSPSSLGGRYLLSPLCSIRQTIVFSPWSWWVINSSVRDPQWPILNHLFIRLWPICNSGKPRSAIIRVGCRPGRPLGGPWLVISGGGQESWLRAEGGVMWTGSMPTKIVTITIRVTLSHQRLSVETGEWERSQRSWHLDKRLSQDLTVSTFQSRVSGHNAAESRCRFRSG